MRTRTQLGRRAFLVSGAGVIAAGAATSTTAGIAAISTAAPDPVFAAIERHRRALAALHHAMLKEDAEVAEAEVHRGTPRFMELANAAKEKRVAVSDVELDAMTEMCCTVPTSLSGAEALIEYVRHIKHVHMVEVFETADPYDFLGHLQCAVGRAASEVPMRRGGGLTFAKLPTATERADAAEFAKLRAIFLPIWERYLPVHQRFAETVDDDGPGGAYHAAWEEWNDLDALARPVAHTVLEYEVSSPRDLAVKAAAALITETAGAGIGDDIRPALANLLLEVVAAGGVAVPDYSWDAEES